MEHSHDTIHFTQIVSLRPDDTKPKKRAHTRQSAMTDQNTERQTTRD